MSASVSAAILCDRPGCENDFMVFPIYQADLAAAIDYTRQSALQHGWRCDPDGDFCPHCQADSTPKSITKLIKGYLRASEIRPPIVLD